MSDFLEQIFVGPVWPASVLVCLLAVYVVIALLGLIDLDFGLGEFFEMDSDLSPESVDHGGLLGGIGAATLRWMNLERLPLILWLAVFIVAFWAISYGFWYGFDSRRYEPTLVTSLLLMLRNGVIAVGITKFVTVPLNRIFRPAESYGPSNLLGRHCAVSSVQADARYGQASMPTDAAPLLLNIRTDGEVLPKGTRVEIVDYDADRRVYTVIAANEESS